MKIKLFAAITLIEAVLITLLLFFLTQEMLPDKVGVTLVWIQPIAFGLHIAEEYVFPGGFASRMTPSYPFKINAIGGIASALLSFGAFNYLGSYSFVEIRGWLFVMSALAFNGLEHIRGAILTKRYSPGMVTGIVLFLPLAVISYAYFLRNRIVDIPSALVCIALGSLAQPVLDFFHKRKIR
jgi:hypothetical protein